MAYLLILLVPFSTVMGALMNRNGKLRKRYLTTVAQLEQLLLHLGEQPELSPAEMRQNFVVTNDDYKRVEKLVRQVELALQIERSKTFANQFGSRLKKQAEAEKLVADLVAKHQHSKVAAAVAVEA